MPMQTGNIYGTVTDQQGPPLPGVTVNLSGQGGLPQIQVTDAMGHFRFPGLSPGSYQVKAQLEGFVPATVPAEVSAGQTTDLPITLQLAISQ